MKKDISNKVFSELRLKFRLEPSKNYLCDYLYQGKTSRDQEVIQKLSALKDEFRVEVQEFQEKNLSFRIVLGPYDNYESSVVIVLSKLIDVFTLAYSVILDERESAMVNNIQDAFIIAIGKRASEVLTGSGFIFLRWVEDRAFLTSEAGIIKFNKDYSEDIKVFDMLFYSEDLAYF